MAVLDKACTASVNSAHRMPARRGNKFSLRVITAVAWCTVSKESLGGSDYDAQGSRQVPSKRFREILPTSRGRRFGRSGFRPSLFRSTALVFAVAAGRRTCPPPVENQKVVPCRMTWQFCTTTALAKARLSGACHQPKQFFTESRRQEGNSVCSSSAISRPTAIA